MLCIWEKMQLQLSLSSAIRVPFAMQVPVHKPCQGFEFDPPNAVPKHTYQSSCDVMPATNGIKWLCTTYPVQFHVINDEKVKLCSSVTLEDDRPHFCALSFGDHCKKWTSWKRLWNLMWDTSFLSYPQTQRKIFTSIRRYSFGKGLLPLSCLFFRATLTFCLWDCQLNCQPVQQGNFFLFFSVCAKHLKPQKLWLFSSYIILPRKLCT